MKKIARYLPSIIWMSIIFLMSTRPTADVITSDPTVHYYVFKSFHLVEYSILALLLFFGFRQIRPTIIFGYLYSLSDEIHQSFVPGRTPMIRDTFIDLIGITLGLIIIQILLQITPIRKALYK